MMKRREVSAGDIYWMVRRTCLDHLKILLFDEDRFSIIWYSLKGLVDGLRGRVGPLDSAGTATHRDG